MPKLFAVLIYTRTSFFKTVPSISKRGSYFFNSTILLLLPVNLPLTNF